MDSRFFRVSTEPNYYYDVSTSEAKKQSDRITTRYTLPTSDSRYPGYAAPMSDGRIVTDYRTHCYENIQPLKQFATKEWMQKNTEEIIRVSRDRQAKNAGANYTNSDTMAPPEKLVQCNPTECTVVTTGLSYGIGTERVDKIPNLFGTYEVKKEASLPNNTSITHKYEGGRNTVRGRNFTPFGDKPISATKYTF